MIFRPPSPLPAALTDDPLGDHPYLWAPKLIRALALTGRFDEAAGHAGTLWQRWRDAGSPPMTWMASAVAMAALVHGLRGDESFATWRARACETARVSDPTDSSDIAAPAAFVDARVALHSGQFDAADGLVEKGFAPFAERWWEPYARASSAELAVAAARPDAAARLTAARPWARENAWAAACLARAAGRMGDTSALMKSIELWERLDARFERACTLVLVPRRAAEGKAELHALRCAAPA